MAPTLRFVYENAPPTLQRRTDPGAHPTGDWRSRASNRDFILEAWSQGFIVGALLIMACVTIANMRRKVLLHKLILAELLLAMSHGTFVFGGTNWYLSSTAALLYTSWIIHNIVSFMKVRPFLSTPGGFFGPRFSLWSKRVYGVTLACTVPVIVFQVTDNFRFFNESVGWYRAVRPYEPLMRDPWWIFCCFLLFVVLKRCYGTGIVQLVRRSPRFGILLFAIIASMVFTGLDVADGLLNFTSSTSGINPWWKLSLVFKCLTDTIVLDDFKTELKRLGVRRIQKEERRRNTVALIGEDDHYNSHDSDREHYHDYESSDTSSFPRKSFNWYGRGRGRDRGYDRRDTSVSLSPKATRQEFFHDTDKYHPHFTALKVAATSEEVEFCTTPRTTSTTLAPRTRSRSRSPSATPSSPPSPRSRQASQEKHEITNHTTPLTLLPTLPKLIPHSPISMPKLREWRFEAIKSGPSSRLSRQEPKEEEGVEENNGFSSRSPTSKPTVIERSHDNIDTEGDPDQSTKSEIRRSRFMKSIGAAEFRFDS